MSSEPVPVEPCTGWTSSCSFCNKRFSDWKEVDDEEVLTKVPEQPITFMLALDSKQQKEVVVIATSISDCQQSVAKKINLLRQNVSQRKSKDTKSAIVLRWMNLPQATAKDACTLYAHWYNYGILPRFTTEWPGEKELKTSGHYNLSSLTGKWCHNMKEAVWRKSKTSHAPKAVKKCKWTEACAFCDARFTPWRSLAECREKKLAPHSAGFVMYAAKLGNKYKVYKVMSHQSIADAVKDNYVSYIIQSEESADTAPSVRWMTHQNIEDDDSCFIYAHWFNASEKPYMNINPRDKYHTEFGEKVLVKNSKFSFRSSDKQWCYLGDVKVKPNKVNKNKEKKYVQQSIEEELVMET